MSRPGDAPKSIDDLALAVGGMDPLTAGLNLVNSIVGLITEVVRGQPNDVREALWRLHLEDVKNWRAWLQTLHGSTPPTAMPVLGPDWDDAPMHVTRKKKPRRDVARMLKQVSRR